MKHPRISLQFQEEPDLRTLKSPALVIDCILAASFTLGWSAANAEVALTEAIAPFSFGLNRRLLQR